MPNSAYASAASPVASGGIAVAPLGSAIPVDTSTALNAAFKRLGYVDKDGLSPAGEAPSFNNIFAWGGDLVAAPMESKATNEWEFNLLEILNPDVAKLVFGETNVTVTPATVSSGTEIAILDNGFVIPRMAVVFDMLYAGKGLRFACPDVQLVKTEEGAYTDAELSFYKMKATAFPNASGVSVYRYYLNTDKLAA